jgi:hypothetical protein
MRVPEGSRLVINSTNCGFWATLAGSVAERGTVLSFESLTAGDLTQKAAN